MACTAGTEGLNWTEEPETPLFASFVPIRPARNPGVEACVGRGESGLHGACGPDNGIQERVAPLEQTFESIADGFVLSGVAGIAGGVAAVGVGAGEWHTSLLFMFSTICGDDGVRFSRIESLEFSFGDLCAAVAGTCVQFCLFESRCGLHTAGHLST